MNLLKCNGDHAILTATLSEAFLALTRKASVGPPAACLPSPPHCVPGPRPFPPQFFLCSECVLLMTASLVLLPLPGGALILVFPALGSASRAGLGSKASFLEKLHLTSPSTGHLISSHIAVLPQRTPCPGSYIGRRTHEKVFHVTEHRSYAN